MRVGCLTLSPVLLYRMKLTGIVVDCIGFWYFDLSLLIEGLKDFTVLELSEYVRH